MSLNPVLTQDVHTKALLPLCANGEAYVLNRPKTSVTVDLKSRKLVGKGDTVLTTHRIVFIKNQDKDFKKTFSSLSVPFSHLETPRFYQPVFGTNHLKFFAKSDRDEPHPFESEGVFKLYFDTGGAELFLKMFYTFYARFRNNPNLMSSNNPILELEGDNCVFVDPSDLTRIYFTQPETTVQSTTMPQGETTGTNQQDQQPNTEQQQDQQQQQNQNQNQQTARSLYHAGRGAGFLRFFCFR